jgi:hypothetical protein
MAAEELTDLFFSNQVPIIESLPCLWSDEMISSPDLLCAAHHSFRFFSVGHTSLRPHENFLEERSGPVRRTPGDERSVGVWVARETDLLIYTPPSL